MRDNTELEMVYEGMNDFPNTAQALSKTAEVVVKALEIAIIKITNREVLEPDNTRKISFTMKGADGAPLKGTILISIH